MTEKRYQVFVSSTFADLQEERQEVMHALLELDCIPSGMELFPAANETQWDLIKRVIDDCDYYILILAGRYGSMASDGLSYTEKEYRYALSINKPTIAFLHKQPGKIPADKTEESSDGKEKLKLFRELLQQKLCKHWTTAHDLGSVVSRSLIQLIRTTPAIGWVRANELPDGDAALELLRLRRQVEELDLALKKARSSAPPGTENLAKGKKNFSFAYTFEAKKDYQRYEFSDQVDVTWDDLFAMAGPVLLNEATDTQIKTALQNGLMKKAAPDIKTRTKGYTEASSFKISQDHFNTVKVQLKALGLMVKSDRNRSVKDTSTYWCLTPYGDEVLTRLLAIKA